MAKPYLAIQKHSNFEMGARQCWSPFFSSYPMPFIIFDPCMNLCESPRHLDIFPWATASSVQARLPRHQLRRPEAKNWKFLKEPSFKNNKTTHIIYIPVQIGPEGLGAPFCSYRTASPRCPSYKLAEPNVHRGRFLLQNGSPSWPLVTKWVTDFARLASARIRWLDLPFTEWWGLGVAILALS